MPPRSRHAVDPSLLAAPAQQGQGQGQWQQQQQQPPPGPTFSPAGFGQQQQPQQPQLYQQPQQGYQQPQQGYQQQYVNPAGPQLHQVSDRRTPPPTGPYAPPGASQQYGHPNVLPQQPMHHQQQQQQPVYPPENHIRPPPHSTGANLSGPRVRLDPSQVPDPVDAQEMDQNVWDDEDFHSCDTKGLIPFSTTDYRGVDQGNSLPRHIRSTLPVIPSTAQLLNTTGLPFGVVVQPFAPLRYDEEPIPLVSSWVAGQSASDAPSPAPDGEEPGPPRCDKCRGYINPWVRFIDGGRKWVCNLCNGENAVHAAYFAHIAATGQRVDHQDRPELLHGTVDFAVPREYWFPQPASLLDAEDTSAATFQAAGDALATTGADLLGALQSSLGAQTPVPSRGTTPQPGHRNRHHHPEHKERKLRPPMPLGRVFVIDVSAPSAQRGIVREVCEAIRRGLYRDKKEGEEEANDEEGEANDVLISKGERVAFVTVGQTVGFWNISPKVAQPQLLVVSDLDDAFCPLIGGFLVDPTDARSQVEALLTLIPNMYETQPDGMSCAIGSAIKGALSGLRSTGGQINLFLSGMPVIGPGKLKPREESMSAGTDKEKALFAPGEPFWRVVADELAECGVGVNTFVFPDQAMDLASVSAPTIVTGGEMFFHPKFTVRDRETLVDEVRRVVTRETAYNATVRIRCSNGLHVTEHTGNFYQRSMTDLEFGTIDETKAFSATVRHEGKLNDRQMAYMQVATLYTTASGERRVRLLNLSFNVASLIGNIFRFADLDTTVAVIFNEFAAQLPTKQLREIRASLIERCNRILLAYRRHCAPAVPMGQLVLPEGFGLLPLYALCMIKTKTLKGGNVAPDVRVHYKVAGRSSAVGSIMTMLYPRILAIHDLADSYGFPDKNGRLKIPRFQRASYLYMLPEGAYLLCNGQVAMLWFGNSTSPRILHDLYGVENLDELDPSITQLPVLPTLLSTQVRNILTHLERLAGLRPPVFLVRQDRDGLELEYANQLVEDSNNDALPYTDFLTVVHKTVTNELSGKGSGEGWRAPWS